MARKKKLTAADTLSLPVWKTVYKFTVYSNDQISPHADLRAVIDETDTGAYIGQAEKLTEKTISPRHVRLALRRIGNDGTFFDREPDEDGDGKAP